MPESEEKLWQQSVHAIDRWLVPVAFGALTMLVVTQGITAFPAVRHAVDNRAGRSVATALAGAPAVGDKSAHVTFYVSPTTSRPDVRVMVNGRYQGNLAAGHLTVVLHQGDTVKLVAPNNTSQTEVSVDDNNPYLSSLLPGMMFQLSAQQPSLVLPKVTFLA
ncbi:hypothetical protein [Alicyclobacillus sp. ALC3]|uniref:hypothetical protein n=1 Tax=Alicyclobacillus sp. ALC3 TaxID=2796143 RepID=UPI0023795111|nr:hypothetical protein [Alicyclobacillus sp. ALC3]WDL97124.1 hypothetical protein JC200_23155 [Alicyclobacillus sp. ALC3]